MVGFGHYTEQPYLEQYQIFMMDLFVKQSSAKCISVFSQKSFITDVRQSSKRLCFLCVIIRETPYAFKIKRTIYLLTLTKKKKLWKESLICSGVYLPSSIPPNIPPTMANTRVLLSSCTSSKNNEAVALTKEFAECFSNASLVEVVAWISIYGKNYTIYS